MTGQAPAVQHVVWDWNGTIFGDSKALIDSTIDAFRDAGMEPITREGYQRHHVQPIPLFYDRLAGRTLSPAEQRLLDQHFQVAYLRRRETIRLTYDAVDALTLWRDAGGGQSLLSMYPHDRLVPLVEKSGITGFFSAVDGLVGEESGRKAPHLRRHLEKVGVSPDRVLVIGDSADDARAARECGAACLLYHAGEDALHAIDHFDDLGVPIVHSLTEAVTEILCGAA
jgi:phosphoglycolate phosphatase-like HAD superfamily hydrolase